MPKSPYKNGWERLVAEHGRAGAREIMRQRRAQLTNPKSYFADPENAKKAINIRWQREKNQQSETDDQPQGEDNPQTDNQEA